MAAIRVEDLFHVYPDRGHHVVAVDHISFSVEENQFFTLLGPSGCGKTTTLRCIAGLEVPTGGTIELDGVAVVSPRGVVPTHRRNIGMVFQDYAVWPHMTVFENVAFPLRVARRFPASVIKERVREALSLVNMEQFADRRATQLSGGQQQRLSLARALVRQPSVLLLDEPLSNLDAKLREQMRKELRLLQRRIKVTTLFVTHDQIEALSMSNRIAVMNHGVIMQEGTPREIYLTPQNEFVAAFIGATNFIHATVRATGDAANCYVLDTAVGELICTSDLPLALGATVTVAVRPESLILSDEPIPGRCNLMAEVELGLFVGEAVDYHLRVGDLPLRAKAGPRTYFRRRDKVYVAIAPDECVVLPRSGEPGPGAASVMSDPTGAIEEPLR